MTIERGRPSAAAASRKAVGHEQQHVLGGAHHDRNDDHGQRHGAGQMPEKWPIGATMNS